ncbi:MAG: SIR2 family NAD-dependent protein deacylase, partial [Rhabdochlamydiaceae bacterium]
QQHFDVTVITQNIDDLHERAGSAKVIHLHGEIFFSKSERDPSLLVKTLDNVFLGDCATDGAQLRPHVVFFGEDVPMIGTAGELAMGCDILAVVGTSLAVYPAAGLLSVAKKADKWLTDPNPPELDLRMNIKVIAEPASTGVPKLKSMLLS